MKSYKKPTKKEIEEALRSLNPTKIFKVAKLYGINVESCSDVCRFIQKFAPNKKVYDSAYNIGYNAGSYKYFRCGVYRHRKPKFFTPTQDAFAFARLQKKESKNTNYFKILTEGFNNIYWCHPKYGHSDYNKSIAFPNTEKNRKVMSVINKYLLNGK